MQDSVTESVGGNSSSNSATTANNITSTMMTYHDGSVMSRETLLALTRFYGCIGIICFVFGISLNGLVFKYFYNRRKTLSNTLYCVIVITDIAVSVLMLPYILPHFSEYRSPLLFSSQGFCKFWTVLWGVVSKTTVALVALLGIFRTVLIIDPFNNFVREVKRRYFLAAILLYFVILLVGESVPLWHDYYWYFHSTRMRCQWADLATPGECDEKCNRIQTFVYVWNTLTLAVPVIPMLTSVVVSVWGLSLAADGRSEARRSKREASVTIVLFTLLYVILNIPTLIFWIMMLRDWDSGYTTSLLDFDHPYYFYSNFVDVLTVALNSLLNPLLYLIRMRELRKASLWCCHSQQLASQSQSTNVSSLVTANGNTLVMQNRSIGN